MVFCWLFVALLDGHQPGKGFTEDALGLGGLGIAPDCDFQGPLTRLPPTGQNGSQPVRVSQHHCLRPLSRSAIIPQTIKDMQRAGRIGDLVHPEGHYEHWLVGGSV